MDGLRLLFSFSVLIESLKSGIEVSSVFLAGLFLKSLFSDMAVGDKYRNFLILAVGIVCSGIVRILSFKYSSWFLVKLLLRTKEGVFRAVLRKNMSFFDNSQKGALMKLILDDTRAVYTVFRCSISAISLFLSGAVLLVYAGSLSLPLAALAICISSIGFFHGKAIGKRVLDFSHKVTDLIRSGFVTCEETLGAVKHLKLLNASGFMFKKFNDKSREAEELNRRGDLLVQWQELASMIFMVSCAAVVSFVGFKFLHMPLHTLAFLFYVLRKYAQCMTAFNREIWFVNSSLPQALRVVDFMEKADEDSENIEI